MITNTFIYIRESVIGSNISYNNIDDFLIQSWCFDFSARSLGHVSVWLVKNGQDAVHSRSGAVGETVVEPTKQPASETVVEPTKQPTSETVVEPTKQPTSETVVGLTKQPTRETVVS